VQANNKHPSYVDLGLKNITFRILAGCARRGLVGPSAHPDIHYRALEAFHQNGLKMEFLRTASLIAEVPHWRLNFATAERVIETLLSMEEDGDDEDRTFGLIFSLSALLDMSDEDLSRIPKESMQKLLKRCVEECPKFQKDYEKELKQTSRFLERLHGLGRNDLTFEKNFNRLIGLGDTQVEGHLEEMVESKEWKKLAEFLWSHNDTIEVSTALLEVLVEQRGPVEMLEEIFKPMKQDQGLKPLPLQSIALAQIGVTLVWSLNHEENMGVQVDPEDILRLLEASQSVTDYPVYLIPPLFSPLASTSLMDKCPFLRTPFPVTKTMFLCIHYWANNNTIQKAVKPIYHLKCAETRRLEYPQVDDLLDPAEFLETLMQVFQACHDTGLMWRGHTERELRDSGAFLFKDYLCELMLTVARFNPVRGPQMVQLREESFNRCLNSALNATTSPGGLDDTAKIERVINFVNFYKSKGLTLTQGNIRGVIHMLQGVGDPRAAEWFRLYKNFYSRSLADIASNKAIFVNFQLTGPEIHVLFEEALKELGSALNPDHHLQIRRLGDPQYYCETLASEDKPIVDLYAINVEIDRETEVIQPTGIVSMDFQAAQSTEERIEATLKNMGLALNERESKYHRLQMSGKAVMRFLFTEVLNL